MPILKNTMLIKKLLIIGTTCALAACASYEPPIIAAGTPKAKINLESSDEAVSVYVSFQGCRPPILFLGSELLTLKHPIHGLNGDASKKQAATRFAADVPANKTLAIITTKQYSGRTTFSWVSTGTAPIMVPRTEVLHCEIPAFNWTPIPGHVYQLSIDKTGNNVCDVRTKLIDVSLQNSPAAISTTDMAKSCQ